jgi:WD40 repeat protein
VKPHHPLPPGVIARLGSSAFRLTERYGTVFLVPPHFRTYAASDSGEVREYDLLTGEPVRVILPREANARFVGVSGDGTRMAVSTDTTFQVLRVADRKVLFSTPVDHQMVGYDLSPGGSRVAVLLRNPDTEQRESDHDMEACYVRAVIIHSVGARSAPRQITPLLNFALVPHFSPDGRYITVCGRWEAEFDDQPKPFDGDTVIQVWDVTTGNEVLRLTPDDAGREPSVQFGTCTLLVGVGYPERPVTLYDIPSGEVIRKYRSSLPRGRYTLTSDGRVLACLVESTDELVRIEAQTGVILDKTKSPFGSPASSSLSANADRRTTHAVAQRPDGAVVVLQSVEQSVLAWTAPGGEAVCQPVGGNIPAKAVTFTADGREVLTAGAEPVARRWDARTGELIGEIRLPKGMADRMALVRFQSPELLVADSSYGGAEFNLRTRKARFWERESSGPDAWEACRSPDGWVVEYWSADTEARRMSRGSSELRVGQVSKKRRLTLTEFEGEGQSAAIDRGRVLFVFERRDQPERQLMCFRVSKGNVQQEWAQTFRVGERFADTYEERRRADVSKVAFSLSRTAILWAPDGVTALLIPWSEQVPFVIDPDTGNTLHQWSQAIRGPHAVHPTLPLLATCSPHGNDLLLLDWRTGKRRAVLMEQCYPHALAWSPDGTRLVAALPDGTAMVFLLELDS